MNRILIVLLFFLSVGIAYYASTKTGNNTPNGIMSDYKDNCQWTYFIVGDISVKAKVSLHDIEIVSPKGLPTGYEVEGGYGILVYDKYVNTVKTSKFPLLTEDILKSVTPKGSTLVMSDGLKITVKTNCLEDPDQFPSND